MNDDPNLIQQRIDSIFSESDYKVWKVAIEAQLKTLFTDLKREAKDCAVYCAKKRKLNFENRKISSLGSQQGVSGEGAHKEHLRIPRLVEFQMDEKFGLDWRNDKDLKTEAYRWACASFPEFRLVDGHRCIHRQALNR